MSEETETEVVEVPTITWTRPSGSTIKTSDTGGNRAEAARLGWVAVPIAAGILAWCLWPAQPAGHAARAAARSLTAATGTDRRSPPTGEDRVELAADDPAARSEDESGVELGFDRLLERLVEIGVAATAAKADG